MASSLEFVEYVLDQMQEAGQMRTKKMFGEYGIYCNDIFVGCICDNQCYLKVTEEGKSLLEHPRLEPAYEGAKPSLVIENLEDRTFLGKLVGITSKVLADTKKNKVSKKKSTSPDSEGPINQQTKEANKAGKQKLSSLPNIGKVVEKQLCAVGIEDIETLRQIGSKAAWLRIQKIDDSACYNRLCALEGALQGIRWHDLSEEKKSELKSFYEAHH